MPGASDEDARHDEADEHRRLAAVTVFQTIRGEGEEELSRPAMSLWWSGIAAGLALSTSVLAEAVLYRALAGNPAREAIAALGYALGFVLVILARLQLFTENTLTVVLPLMAKPSSSLLWRSACPAPRPRRCRRKSGPRKKASVLPQ